MSERVLRRGYAGSMSPTDLLADIQHAVDARWPDILDTLTHMVTIPGIAWPSYDRAPLDRSAETVATLIKDLGFDDVEIISEQMPADHEPPVDGDVDPHQGGPAVLAHRRAADGQPTVMLYAHHDVQPTGDLSLWDTDPWTAEERNGRLYGRGAADDKAGIMVHLSAIAALTQVLGDQHGLGITVFIEGEEEAGSPTFRTFLEHHRDRLAADAIVVADSANWKVGVPALTTSLRGLVDGVIGVRVLDHAVHSGMFGGPVLDAPTVLARLIASLHDDDGNVAIPGLQPQYSADLEYPETDFRTDSSVVGGLQLAGSGSLADRLWNRAALSIIGTDIPHIDQSSNTLQPVAHAKFSMRLGPGMDPQQAYHALQNHLHQQPVFGADVFVEPGEFGEPFRADTDDPAAQMMLGALRQAWDVEPVEAGMGGSIPFTADLREAFPDASILITGVEDPDTRAHSANESLHLDDFRKAIIAETLFLVDLLRTGHESRLDESSSHSRE